MDRAETAQVTRVEGLQQIEGLRAPDLAHQNAIGSMAQRCPDQIGNRDGWQRRFLSHWELRPPSFKSQQIWLGEMDLRRLLDDDETFVVGDARGKSVQERGLPGSSSSRDEDVLL